MKKIGGEKSRSTFPLMLLTLGGYGTSLSLPLVGHSIEPIFAGFP